MRYQFELIVGIIIILFIGIFLYTTSINPDAEFSGTDTVGSAIVSDITGIPEEDMAPLIPQWVPPSGEVEACIFALQAAFGGIVLGLCFGYLLAQRKTA
ncbi:MAG TPA: energy-coupling factor ABC transporter substrate-binding protein [Methanospirillum sp.]|uniref:energy-coupling factor ABC transporter substrate-binding protein n=1 Tax=Methanospirillum sp. TaxID=45200 RepID=UPI002CAC02AB|nr:energy-coupling factor ABC transporter substrate-binding protein [Methanospirillum sp.]HOJ97091.1 energy-coupling factor ABC transporter substrate-binding protein [Methanospirillum sp.]HOL40921.1 energy-coupling factor ABC transporter substrate-binding protein [Methanospirillum sp.]